MAGSRYNARKKLVLDEANAIETTYLRVKLLSKTYYQEIQDFLRNYVNARAQLQKADFEIVRQVITESEELHNLLWSEVVR